MPTKCSVDGCSNMAPYTVSINPYCHMHAARLRRNGHFGHKENAYASLKKIPHELDGLIRVYCRKLTDATIAKRLRKMGYRNITTWNVRYRRRKIGIKKYAYGKDKKYKEWVRLRAVEQFGDSCELCGFNQVVDVHHLKPRSEGGGSELSNLMVVCPNCHAMITRGKLYIERREDIPTIKEKVVSLTWGIY